MRISLVVAVAENGVIGRDGRLPWQMRSDLKRFRAITIGNGTAALSLAGPLFTPALVRGHVDLLDREDESGASLSLAGTGYGADISEADGAYQLAGLLPGTYTLLAECPGYHPQAVEVSLESAEQAVIDLALIPITTEVPGPDAEIAGGVLAGGSVSPNPFRSAATISFALAGPGRMRARIYDAEGRLRRSLVEGKSLLSGEHSLSWDGHDDAGREVPTGIYFVEVRVASSAGGAPGSSASAIRLPVLRLR